MGDSTPVLLLVDILGRYPGHPPGSLPMSHNQSPLLWKIVFLHSKHLKNSLFQLFMKPHGICPQDLRTASCGSFFINTIPVMENSRDWPKQIFFNFNVSEAPGFFWRISWKEVRVAFFPLWLDFTQQVQKPNVTPAVPKGRIQYWSSKTYPGKKNFVKKVIFDLRFGLDSCFPALFCC